MSDPAVSAVIACFNYARWLPDSVASVLSQTLTDLELLIVDDGSTDDSLAVARRLATCDPRITVLAHPNAGQPAIPRNRAIERARGRYVVSLDADDRLSPTALERCAAELDGDPRAGLAYLQRQDFGSSCELHPHLDWRVEQLKRANFLSSSAMFRRPAWEAAGGYSTNVRGYEDWDLWLGIAEAGFTGRRTLGALFYYRRHEGGVYSESTDGDQRLKAQVVVNRSGMFGDGVLGWARGVLARDQDALDVPEQLGVVPVIPDPPHPLRIARDRAVRADWYVDVDGLDGPWPSRSLPESLSVVDRLGYTTVRAGGAP
ncbi:MAG: glycosyltransferase family 2 protein, partial [Solirubrobacteraceae bacterium]